MTKPLIATGLAAMLDVSAGPRPRIEGGCPDRGQPDLEGGYTIVSGEKFGKPEPKERVEGATVRITADRIVATDKDKKEVYGVEYTLDASTTPHKITMVSKLSPKEETSGA